MQREITHCRAAMAKRQRQTVCVRTKWNDEIIVGRIVEVTREHFTMTDEIDGCRYTFFYTEIAHFTREQLLLMSEIADYIRTRTTMIGATP